MTVKAAFSAAKAAPLLFAGGLVLYAADAGCLFRRATGLECPGCGLTRAARALCASDVAGALRLNILSVPLVFAAVAAAAMFLTEKRTRKKPLSAARAFIRRRKAAVIAVASALAAASWIYNIKTLN
jgi:hypothetical protein